MRFVVLCDRFMKFVLNLWFDLIILCRDLFSVLIFDRVVLRSIFFVV